jgi:capsular exopolysaccharide synthesis family protein
MSAQGTTLTETEISTLDSELATAKEQEAEQEARLQTARSQMARGSTGEDVGEAMSSPVVQQLRAQRTILTQKIADLQGRYGDRHPELLKANRELADIDAQIKQEIQRIISSLEAQAQVARQRAASIAASVAQSKGSLAGNDRASVKLDELQRNADAAKALYDSFLARFKETTAQQGLEQNDARIVSLAKIPTGASYPKKSTNFAIGLMLAIAAGLGAAVLADALDSGLATAEDVERELDIPYLGAIPAASSTLDSPKARERSKTSAIDLVVESPLSSFAESFRNLRASLLYSRVGETVKVILITSSLPGEGKTTTSIALARTMALAGSRVVVVDCDLRQRSLIRLLPGEPKAGLLEVLNGTVSLEQALIHDEASGAMILPLVRSTYTPKDVFGTAAMKSLMAALRQHFDIVILDTAPVLPIADTRVLASAADVVVLLVRWRKTPNKAAQAALRLLTSVNAYVAGAALTQVDLRAQARYGYGDPGYYYQSYKKYYGQ